MADKQIIIDGVDVSGCENLMQGIVPFGCMEDRKTCSCMNNPNCLYKQLKRLEQENNILKQSEDEAKEIIAELKAENKKLKKENKDLKIYIESNKQQVEEAETLVMDNARLLQTLEEIKVYVNAQLDGFGNAVYGITKNQITTITNKINEVLK